jgi:hypothetical protein
MGQPYRGPARAIGDGIGLSREPLRLMASGRELQILKRSGPRSPTLAKPVAKIGLEGETARLTKDGTLFTVGAGYSSRLRLGRN